MIALDGSFPVMHADRGPWLYPTAGLLLSGRHARLDVRSMAPFAIGDGIVGAVRYLATGSSELPPLMGALNRHNDPPVAIPALAVTLDGLIPRDDGAHGILGGEYRLVLAGRPFEADLSGPEEPRAGMDTERTVSFLLNQVALRGGLAVDTRGTRVHAVALAGNGFGTLSLWNPLLGLEFAVHTPARGWAGFHARLRGQVQHVGYAGYEPVNRSDAPFWDTDIREWTRTLSLELGMTLRLGR
ncbi:MAG: hypothetical protein EA398_06405 [Deltaproteobacteria bacterium]|nr:MAG: hypothetical protein EA398_06405 [Deltaproteobacteria bacterium]